LIIAHNEKCERTSTGVAASKAPWPMCRMSGSFQWPGPAYSARLAALSKLCSMLVQLAVMSALVRHRLPTSLPQLRTLAMPQAQIDST